MDALRSLTSTRRIFPRATLDDLFAELADTDRAIDRLGEGFVTDVERRRERERQLEWWRNRILDQIARMQL